MNPLFTHTFLGNTSTHHHFKSFKISVVDYTQMVSESWHYHEKIHLSSIIKGGNLESRKSKDIQVNPGKIIVYEQGEVHRNRFTAHPSKNLNIEFAEHFFSEDICFSNLRLNEQTNTELHKIYFELLLNDVYSAQSIEQIVRSLFWIDTYDSHGIWIPQLLELLNDRWDEFLPLAELSQKLKVHPVTISKYFPRYCGMTLSEYMRKIKVKRAVDLLINTSWSAAEIAFTCGFSDQSHMTRLLKKHIGYTPGAIRSLK